MTTGTAEGGGVRGWVLTLTFVVTPAQNPAHGGIFPGAPDLPRPDPPTYRLGDATATRPRRTGIATMGDPEKP